MNIGLIILIVAIIAFVIMGAILIGTGFKNQWPDGDRTEIKGKRATVNLIIGSDEARREMNSSHEKSMLSLPEDKTKAKRIYAMVVALKLAWKEVFNTEKTKELDEVAVLLLSDEEYENYVHPTQISTNAVLLTVNRRIGHGPHLVVMRAKLMWHCLETGEPVIHELLHTIGGDYYHKDKKYWSEFSEEKDSLQFQAREKYKDLIR